MLNRRADKLELLRIAEAVALEKSIDKELIISSMENGIAKAAKSKFGSENEIKVLINRESGDIGIFRKLVIVDIPENSNLQISLDDAVNIDEKNKEKKVGDEVLQPLPSFDFGRIAAQTAKQVITLNVREAERERQYNEFIDKKDTILSGIVKRLEFGNVIVDLGRTEAIIQVYLLFCLAFLSSPKKNGPRPILKFQQCDVNICIFIIFSTYLRVKNVSFIGFFPRKRPI